MKTAEEYPVTFPYGATTHPYTPDHPHTGEDRKMPVGTPININGHTVALSGNSGKSTGPHDHTQRVANGKVQPPLGGGFALPEPVVVIETGERADIGKFIRLRDGNGEIWSHFHLSEIKVKAGQKIGEDVYQGKTAEQWAKDAKFATSVADERYKQLKTVTAIAEARDAMLKSVAKAAGISAAVIEQKQASEIVEVVTKLKQVNEELTKALDPKSVELLKKVRELKPYLEG